MSIRDNLINLIGGRKLSEERTKTQQSLEALWSAYQDGPYRMPPQMLMEKLSELDSSTILYLIRSMGANYSYTGTTEDQRAYQVTESRYQWYYSPLAQWSVNVWTSYGLGERVTVACNDDGAQAIWENTWNDSPVFDDDSIHMLSASVLVDGDVYLAAFISIADGDVQYEYMANDEVTEIITNPANKNQALYYKREYVDASGSTITIYYPDWHTYFYHNSDLEKAGLPEDAIISVSEQMTDNGGTTVLVMHIAHNRKDPASLHGWPILGIAAPYMRAHKEFVENRLTVSRQKAMFVREFITGGGSRGVEAVRAKLGTGMSSSNTTGYADPNPPAISGSNLIHNQAVEHKDMPMTTGASDATGDNNMFAWMALIGAGLFPTSAGMDTSRWATAVAMDKTQAVQWSRYQSFWSCQFRKMVELVLMAAEEWGGATIEDKGCVVSIDSLALVDFPGIVPGIAQMMNALTGSVTDGTVNQNAAREISQALWYPVLTALGAENVDEILSDDSLGIVDPEDAEAVNKAMVELARMVREKRLREAKG